VEPQADLKDVPFKEAIDHHRQKVSLPTEAWTDLVEGAHARAFVVAGATRAEVIEGFRTAVDKALAEGTTLAEFRKAFDRIVAATGWQHKGTPGWRSRVIFETNVRTAYAAGRWAQVQRQAERLPYLRYSAILDSRTRAAHRSWNGTILRVDDPWWRTHYPPNGWGCRCSTIQLSERDLARRGWQVSEAPADQSVPKVIRSRGQKVAVETPQGIDPGWAYNPGEAAWGRSEQAIALEAHGPWTPLEGPLPAASRPLPPIVEPRAALGPAAESPADAAAAARAALGGEAATFTDPAGERVRATEAIAALIEADNGLVPWLPRLRETVEAPSEIWVGFLRSEASGRVLLRRRYVRRFVEGSAVVDIDRGLVTGLRVLGTALLERLRAGLLIWPRSGE
jgi:SPP1 gp7 family putative phage head morphogenesis protein